MQYAAVRLFVERARAGKASFAMTPHNAPAIVRVCQRLDGIPLAIELAAARVRAMPVEQIAGRLDDRFRLLTGGSRTALQRQQTLRASIDWSYDLLCEPERCLLRRLSVFAGGWTLEATEAVCSDRGLRIRDSEAPAAVGDPTSSIQSEEVLDLLQGLVEKSLVVYEEQDGCPLDGARYWMLETVRQYASERLLEEGEAEAIRARHLDYFLGLAEAAEPHHLTGAQRGEWLERLETEHDNLRAALDWALSEAEGRGSETGETGGVEGPAPRTSETIDPQPGSPHPLHSRFAAYPVRGREATIPRREAALRLAAALFCFWTTRGHLTEGRERLALALASATGAVTEGPVRAKALDAAGYLASCQADYEAARALHEESLAIKREFGDLSGIARSLDYLGVVAHEQEEYGTARSRFEESLAIRRELGDRLAIADSLNHLGMVAYEQGDYAAARAPHEESLAIRRELGDRSGIAYSLNHLGFIARGQGEYAAARALHEQALAIRRELGDRSGIAYALDHLGRVAQEQADYESARALYEESLAIRRELGERSAIANSLNHLGMVASKRRDYGTARARYEESLAIRRELGNRSGIAQSLEALAVLACELQERPGADELAGAGGAFQAVEATDAARAAARLFGAATALREAVGTPVPPSEQEAYRRAVCRARERLGEEAFAAAWAEGRALPLDQAIADALHGAGESLESSIDAEPEGPGSGPLPMSER
jgi:predicted ATPase/uncharacterized protein HemY